MPVLEYIDDSVFYWNGIPLIKTNEMVDFKKQLKILQTKRKMQSKMIPLTRPLTFIDLETTGLNTAKDNIIQISVIKFFPDREGTEIKTRLIKPQVPISPDASKVHGITMEQLEDKPLFCQIWKPFYNGFIKGCDIAGQNILSFDVPLLIEEFERCGFEWNIENVNFIDTKRLAEIVFSKHLTDMYKVIFGTELAGAHDAEADNLACVDVFSAFANGREITIDPLKLLHERLIDTALDNKNKAQPNYKLTIDDMISLSKPAGMVDLARKITINNGEYCWNFGKHRGEIVKNFRDYIKWCIAQQDFPSESKKWLMKISKGEI